MLFDEFANFIELHKIQIARWIAQKAVARKLPLYHQLGVQVLATKFLPTVEMLERHIRHNDPTEYRDYIAKLTQHRLSDGHNAEDIITMGRILNEVIATLLLDKFAGPENRRTRERYLRRLEGVLALAQNTVIATRLKERAERSSLV